MNRLYSFLFCCLLFACGSPKRANNTNTFYISFISNNSTLLEVSEKESNGKVSFIDARQEIQLLPITYLTEERDNLHYFNSSKFLPDKPELGTIKYIVKFNDSVYHYNIAYELSKYVYLKKGWQLLLAKGSFMPYQNLSALDSTLPYNPKRLVNRVMKHIVADSYGK